jgi:hypothetical protein
VLGQRRSPRVQHGGDADPGAEMLRVRRDPQHGLGRSLEQQVVDDGLVLVCDVGDLGRQREDDVEVSDRQQIGLALGEPGAGGRTLRQNTRRTAAAPASSGKGWLSGQPQKCPATQSGTGKRTA